MSTEISGIQRIQFRTESLCPVCLKRILAFRVSDGPDVYLEKRCKDHGAFRTVIWRGSPSFASWVRPKLPVCPPVCYTDVARGCPLDCGLCASHRQITCTALIEITRRCNLRCRYCFADAGALEAPDPDMKKIRFWYSRVHAAAPACNIQISGGEPTVRDDLPRIIEMGKGMGFDFVQLNTNGLRLGEEPGYAERLKEAGLSSVFLQFDGVTTDTFQMLRGRDLLAVKERAVERCAAAGLGVVLVPLVVPGVNDHEIGAVVKWGVKAFPAVRGVHFQPVSYFGRYPLTPADCDRMTLPEIMTALENQTDGMIHAADFRPPGCENALCSFHARFLVTSAERLTPLISLPMTDACCKPFPADKGARRTIAAVAKDWGVLPAEYPVPDKPHLSANTSSGDDNVMDMDSFLEAAQSRVFSISAMAFQDVWNLDLERLQDCCIHVVSDNGRLIPFCACNLTDSQGRPLYR